MSIAFDAAISPRGDDLSSVVLGVRGVSKRYKGIHALNGVSVSVHHSESLALIGANGAGKSTLVRVLTGAVTPDEGQVVVDGRVEQLRSVREARRHGIGYVPQELTIATDLTLAENVLAAGWDSRGGIVRSKAGLARVATTCSRIGLEVSPTQVLRRLSPAEHRLVMIARALIMHPKTMILDEPTAALADREADRIVSVLNQLRAEGISLVYISHRMGEIARLCDSLVVLRDGRVVMEGPATSESVERAVAVGIGGVSVSGVVASASAGTATEAGARVDSPPALRCSGLRNRVLDDVSLEVGVGEVVGLAGLLGSGRTEILRAVAGADRLASGTVEIFGRSEQFHSPADAVRAGVAMLPEDRRGQGGLLGLSISDNLVLADIPSRRAGFLHRSEERRIVSEAIDRFGIKCQSPDAPLQSLSGGNQQKVILARWLLSGARLLLLDEPTAGIDVVAKAEILSIVTSAVHAGRAALVVSSELAELCELCDRIYVVSGGAIRDCVERGVTVAQLARLCGDATAAAAS